MALLGVILAAGRSTRMSPFSEHYPKPVLPIMNKPILWYQLVQMRNIGVTEVIVVVSHLGFEIVRHLERNVVEGLTLHYVDQGETLGIAHALGTLENRITSPFVLMLGDIYFISDRIGQARDRFLNSGVHAVLVSKHESSPDEIKRNFAILLNDDGAVRRVIEKPRYVENNIKGCGIYFFDLHIFDAIRRTPRTAMRDEYEITDSIQILINDGFRVEHESAVDEDMNLTFPGDILQINRFELERRGQFNHIDSRASLDETSLLQHCVVGADAIIEKEVHLQNCTVFPGTRVAASTKAISVIFTPHQSIQCPDNILLATGE